MAWISNYTSLKEWMWLLIHDLKFIRTKLLKANYSRWVSHHFVLDTTTDMQNKKYDFKITRQTRPLPMRNYATYVTVSPSFETLFCHRQNMAPDPKTISCRLRELDRVINSTGNWSTVQFRLPCGCKYVGSGICKYYKRMNPAPYRTMPKFRRLEYTYIIWLRFWRYLWVKYQRMSAVGTMSIQ